MFIWMMACTGDKDKDSSVEMAEETIDWQAWAVNERGPFNVGHIQIQHTYQPLLDQPERTIPIEIWYPTEDTSGVSTTYFVGVDDTVFSDATPAAPIYPAGYPVHLSSHGYQGWGANSTFLMSHFASHGWVVVAPNHINNTIIDHASPLPVNHFVHRPKDLIESLNVLESLELGYPVDVDNVLMSGHSFGASYSTWGIAGASYDGVDSVCQEGIGLEDSNTLCTETEYAALSSGELNDDRIKAAIPMAGTDRKTFFGETGYQSVDVPVLFISGTEDGQEGNQAHFDEVTGIDFRWLSLKDACHQSFTVGGCATMEAQLGFDILNHYVLAFGRQQILGDDSLDALLDGVEQPWSEATLLVKE